MTSLVLMCLSWLKLWMWWWNRFPPASSLLVSNSRYREIRYSGSHIWSSTDRIYLTLSAEKGNYIAWTTVSNSVLCLWVQKGYQISCKISSHAGEDTHILHLILEEKDVSPASPGTMICVWPRIVTRSLGGAEDKMSLRIMWLPLRYRGGELYSLIYNLKIKDSLIF